MNVMSIMKDVGFSGFFDMAIMTLLIYSVLVWFKRTRAAFVLTGILIVSGFYLLTRQFNLMLTASIFERFFAVILVAMVVIFQEELRHLFERVAVWSLNRRIVHRAFSRLGREEVDVLVRTLSDLAREKTGALAVIRGKDMIVRHLDGGIDLHGELSEDLLKSIFDPHSAGHDGAVVIEGNRVLQFAAHLPLSKNLHKIGKGGTRHAAALGLSELTDAICVVVSEERGTISVARNGELWIVTDPRELSQVLEGFYQEIMPRRDANVWRDFFRRNSREKVVALALAVGLWAVLVYGSKIIYRAFTVPIGFQIPQDLWETSELIPDSVDVTLRGPRSAFYFLRKEHIKALLTPERRKGVQEIRISATDLTFPKGLAVDNIQPRAIRVRLTPQPEQEEKRK